MHLHKFLSTISLLIIAWIAMSCENSNTTSTTTNTGDDTSDFVDEQEWSSVINIVWSGTDVTITGEADGVSVSNSNGYVTVNSTVKNIEYSVSGNGTGQLSIYSTYKYKLSLNGLSLVCSDGPAINNQCHKTCYVVVGSSNTLVDGSTYASSDEDRKAALFSEGQLCFSGSGSLNVTGNYKHAVASDDYIRLCSGLGDMTLTAKGSDGLHANDGIIINDGNLSITAVEEGIQCDTSSVVITGGNIDITSSSDKGILAYGDIEISDGTIAIESKYKCIKTKGNLVISGGTITAIATASSSGGGGFGWSSSSSSGTPEGIEAKGTITISGGIVYAQANDDAINSGGDMNISGGIVMAYSTGNDGLDANGNCYIKGGTVYAIGASSPEVGIDANTEGGCQLYFTGGTLVAIGGVEQGANLSQSCYSTNAGKGVWYALYSGESIAFAFKTPSSLSTTTMVVSTESTPSLESGVTFSGTTILNGYAVSDPTITKSGSSVSLSAYSGGTGNMGGGPGGR